MSRFQAGALVVYGNLGVHEVEGVGLRQFGDESAREYYTLRPYFSDSHDRRYIPTEKEAALRPVTPAQQAEADLARIKAEKLPIPAGVQTALAEHYSGSHRSLDRRDDTPVFPVYDHDCLPHGHQVP